MPAPAPSQPEGGRSKVREAALVVLKVCGGFAGGFLLLYVLCTNAALDMANGVFGMLCAVLKFILEILAEAD